MVMTSFDPAASVVLWRSVDGNADKEFFLVERAKDLTFLGGFCALPGGRVEQPLDSELPSSWDGSDRSLRTAALRELFEETGILAYHGPVLLKDTWAAWRTQVCHNPKIWHTLMTEAGRSFAGDLLVPLGRFLTPAFSTTRFDSQTYALELPCGQEAHIVLGELAAGEWLTLTQALTRYEEGDLYLTFPTVETLRLLQTTGFDLHEASKQSSLRLIAPLPFGEMLSGLRIVPVRSQTLAPATHTNTYILGGEELVVVDPGSHLSLDQTVLSDYIDRLLKEGRRLREIWLTHHHPDHTAGILALQQRFNVPLATHQAAKLPCGLRANRFIQDGEITALPFNQHRTMYWQALHTPGHSPDHMSFYDTHTQALLTGDNILGTGTTVIGLPDSSLTQYLASLKRLQILPIRFGFPGHGAPLGNVARRIHSILEHRRLRERALVRALSQVKQPISASDLVLHVYPNIDAEAHALALDNVVANLHKLAEEQRAERQGDLWLLSKTEQQRVTSSEVNE